MKTNDPSGSNASQLLSLSSPDQQLFACVLYLMSQYLLRYSSSNINRPFTPVNSFSEVVNIPVPTSREPTPIDQGCSLFLDSLLSHQPLTQKMPTYLLKPGLNVFPRKGLP